jgi:hypothetical protein
MPALGEEEAESGCDPAIKVNKGFKLPVAV